MSRKNLYERCIARWGEEVQTLTAIEECSELVEALARWLRKATYKKSMSALETDIYEEMADVQIMLEQLKVMFCCEQAVEDFFDLKLRRIEERLRE